MSKSIAMIPVDHTGNSLFIKDLEEIENKVFLKYRSTLNDIPFMRTEIFVVDDNNNIGIVGTDGTVLFRFAEQWLLKLINE